METHQVVGGFTVVAAVALAASGVASDNEALVGIGGAIGVVGLMLLMMQPRE